MSTVLPHKRRKTEKAVTGHAALVHPTLSTLPDLHLKFLRTDPASVIPPSVSIVPPPQNPPPPLLKGQYGLSNFKPVSLATEPSTPLTIGCYEFETHTLISPQLQTRALPVTRPTALRPHLSPDLSPVAAPLPSPSSITHLLSLLSNPLLPPPPHLLTPLRSLTPDQLELIIPPDTLATQSIPFLANLITNLPTLSLTTYILTKILPLHRNPCIALPHLPLLCHTIAQTTPLPTLTKAQFTELVFKCPETVRSELTNEYFRVKGAI